MLKLSIIGNIGKDAETRDYNGQSVITFNVAHSERYKDAQGQQQERTTWVKCSYWKPQGQTKIADYLKKGTKVYVEGAPSISTWSDRVTNQPVGSLEVRVHSVDLLTQAPQQQPPGPPPVNYAGHTNTTTAPAPATESEDDLPF